MTVENRHYSNKGGHLERAITQRTLKELRKQDLFPSRGEVFDRIKHMNRPTRSGK